MLTPDASAAIDAWRARGQMMRCAGRSLFVVEAGDRAAPPLLLVHGFPTSGWDWHRILDVLAEHSLSVSASFNGSLAPPQPS